MPKNTPTEIVDKLNREVNAGLIDPEIKARLTDLGSVPIPMSPAAFGKLITAETEKWGKVIQATNVKPRLRATGFAQYYIFSVRRIAAEPPPRQIIAL